jgi:hypothetical protein
VTWWQKAHSECVVRVKAKKREQDLERELRDHLDLDSEGQQDRRALGNVTLIKENVREAWGWIGSTGIGANTALFSALDAVLWKSVRVSDPRALRILTWIRSDRPRYTRTPATPLRIVRPANA